MTIMSDPNRAECLREYQADLSIVRDQTNGVLKADIQAALNALDQYFSDNGAAINTTIPQPARSSLTTTQKALLAMHVIRKRYLTGT
jgi:hypothetical protein